MSKEVPLINYSSLRSTVSFSFVATTAKFFFCFLLATHHGQSVSDTSSRLWALVGESECVEPEEVVMWGNLVMKRLR